MCIVPAYSNTYQDYTMPHQYNLWRKIRRPFRYPKCASLKCEWEIFDCDEAGCLKCGARHKCASNSVDNRCPLAICDDLSRVCTITGFVLPEVRHAKGEYMDTMVISSQTTSQPATNVDLDGAVHNAVWDLLMSEASRTCRESENAKQTHRLDVHMQKLLKQFKTSHPNCLPNMCHALASVVRKEKNCRFIQEASEDLVEECADTISRCVTDLKAKGVRVSAGPRLKSLVCGLLYMLRCGLTYQNHLLLKSIPEIEACLPNENKLDSYFGISSKVICETENEIKLVFRGHLQSNPRVC